MNAPCVPVRLARKDIHESEKAETDADLPATRYR